MALKTLKIVKHLYVDSVDPLNMVLDASFWYRLSFELHNGTFPVLSSLNTASFPTKENPRIKKPLASRIELKNTIQTSPLYPCLQVCYMKKMSPQAILSVLAFLFHNHTLKRQHYREQVTIQSIALFATEDTGAIAPLTRRGHRRGLVMTK